ncbi:MAG TPA: hypothetical protein VJP80_03430 [Candidatus Saccharimonadales bacterium]|nr:hypothetical protein [Candidatus Saccharimonadales bacterium]
MLFAQGIGRRLKIVAMGVAALILFLCVSSLSAQGASSIAQGFQTTDSNVVPGALVGLKSRTPNTVELSSADKVEQMLGIAGNKSLIELTNGTGSVQVVTSGTTAALVSDINGSVKVGDRITASPIAGIGMKATTSTLVIGVAQANLANVTTSTRSVADIHGKQTTIHIGAIPIQVDKVYYEVPGQQGSTFLPSSLQDFANSLAGHQVSPVRVLVAGLMVVLLFVIVAVVLYSTVKSSIISIGRNPLSENAVHKSLLEVGITVIGVLVFTVVVVYLVLAV